MAESSAKRRKGRQGGKGRPDDALFDRELDHLPAEVRWREWMNRVEAVIFAASDPVSRETLARIVGKDCSIDLILDDIREGRCHINLSMDAPGPAAARSGADGYSVPFRHGLEAMTADAESRAL